MAALGSFRCTDCGREVQNRPACTSCHICKVLVSARVTPQGRICLDCAFARHLKEARTEPDHLEFFVSEYCEAWEAVAQLEEATQDVEAKVNVVELFLGQAPYLVETELRRVRLEKILEKIQQDDRLFETELRHQSEIWLRLFLASVLTELSVYAHSLDTGASIDPFLRCLFGIDTISAIGEYPAGRGNGATGLASARSRKLLPLVDSLSSAVPPAGPPAASSQETPQTRRDVSGSGHDDHESAVLDAVLSAQGSLYDELDPGGKKSPSSGPTMAPVPQTKSRGVSAIAMKQSMGPFAPTAPVLALLPDLEKGTFSVALSGLTALAKLNLMHFYSVQESTLVTVSPLYIHSGDSVIGRCVSHNSYKLRDKGHRDFSHRLEAKPKGLTIFGDVILGDNTTLYGATVYGRVLLAGSYSHVINCRVSSWEYAANAPRKLQVSPVIEVQPGICGTTIENCVVQQAFYVPIGPDNFGDVTDTVPGGGSALLIGEGASAVVRNVSVVTSTEVRKGAKLTKCLRLRRSGYYNPTTLAAIDTDDEYYRVTRTRGIRGSEPNPLVYWYTLGPAEKSLGADVPTDERSGDLTGSAGGRSPGLAPLVMCAPNSRVSFLSCAFSGAYAGFLAKDASIAVSKVRVRDCAYGVVITGTSTVSIESSEISSCSVGLFLCRCEGYGSIDVSRNRVEQCSECACLLDEVSGHIGQTGPSKQESGVRASLGPEAASPPSATPVGQTRNTLARDDEGIASLTSLTSAASTGAAGATEAAVSSVSNDGGRESHESRDTRDTTQRQENSRAVLATARLLAARRRGAAPLLTSLVGDVSPAAVGKEPAAEDLRIFHNYFLSGASSSLVVISSTSQLDPRAISYNKLDTTSTDALVMQGKLAVCYTTAIFRGNNVIGSLSGKFGFVRHIYDEHQ